ncbi:hypothetical protein [Arthrobacter sp. N1]|uniref:hypothetical protein n=1 Tax=Arthrobacter sp. N1 TaxID=619291 RepID=UPI003BB004B9
MQDEMLPAIIDQGRSVTPTEVARLSHLDLDLDDARAAVSSLRVRGLLGREGEELAYSSPSAWRGPPTSRTAPPSGVSFVRSRSRSRSSEQP